jgi:hypothetical protein
VVFIAISLAIHCVIFVLVQKSVARSVTLPEYTVGTFSIVAGAAGDSHNSATHCAAGKFELHVRFIDDLQSQARTRIATHQYRVRESIENLLRKAHGLELDDAAVARLKHQIQQRVDEAIDLRAVAEVIITDLTLDPAIADPPATPLPTAATPLAGSIPTSTTQTSPRDNPNTSPAAPPSY